MEAPERSHKSLDSQATSLGHHLAATGLWPKNSSMDSDDRSGIRAWESRPNSRVWYSSEDMTVDELWVKTLKKRPLLSNQIFPTLALLGMVLIYVHVEEVKL